MAASTSYAIQEELRTLLRAAALPGIASGNIQARAMPKVGEKVDKLPALRIAPHGEDESVPFAFGGQVNRIYVIEVTLIDALEADLATDQDKHQGWKEAALKKIQKTDAGDVRTTLAGVPSVWLIEVVKAPSFDRAKLAKNYAYQGVVARFHSME